MSDFSFSGRKDFSNPPTPGHGLFCGRKDLLRSFYVFYFEGNPSVAPGLQRKELWRRLIFGTPSCWVLRKAEGTKTVLKIRRVHFKNDPPARISGRRKGGLGQHSPPSYENKNNIYPRGHRMGHQLVFCGSNIFGPSAPERVRMHV